MRLIFGTSEPLLLSSHTTITGAHALQQEKPLQRETLTPEPERRPHSQQLETAGAATKTEHSQKEINIFKKITEREGAEVMRSPSVPYAVSYL